MSGVLVNPIFVPTLAPLTVTGMVNPRRLGVNPILKKWLTGQLPILAEH